MNCKKCGATLNANDEFCMACGELVEDTVSTNVLNEVNNESIPANMDTPIPESNDNNPVVEEVNNVSQVESQPEVSIETPVEQQPVAPVETPVAQQPETPIETPVEQQPVAPIETPVEQQPAVPVETSVEQQPPVPVETTVEQQSAVPVEAPVAQQPETPIETPVEQQPVAPIETPNENQVGNEMNINNSQPVNETIVEDNNLEVANSNITPDNNMFNNEPVPTPQETPIAAPVTNEADNKQVPDSAVATPTTNMYSMNNNQVDINNVNQNVPANDNEQMAFQEKAPEIPINVSPTAKEEVPVMMDDASMGNTGEVIPSGNLDNKKKKSNIVPFIIIILLIVLILAGLALYLYYFKDKGEDDKASSNIPIIDPTSSISGEGVSDIVPIVASINGFELRVPSVYTYSMATDKIELNRSSITVELSYLSNSISLIYNNIDSKKSELTNENYTVNNPVTQTINGIKYTIYECVLNNQKYLFAYTGAPDGNTYEIKIFDSVNNNYLYDEISQYISTMLKDSL